MSVPTRDDAWRLLTEYTSSDSLIKHALAVEAGAHQGLAIEGMSVVGAKAGV